MTACTLSGIGRSALLQRPAAAGLAQRALLDQHPARTRGRRAGCRRPARPAGSSMSAENAAWPNMCAYSVGDVGVAQRRQRDRQRAGDRAGPARVAVDQLRPGGAQQQQRHVARRTRRAARRSAASRRRPSAGPRRPARSGRRAASATRNRRQADSASSAASWSSRAGRPAGAARRSAGSASAGADELAQRPRRAAARAAPAGSVSRMPACGLDDVGQRGVRDVLAERRAAAGAPGDRRVDQPLGVLVAARGPAGSCRCRPGRSTVTSCGMRSRSDRCSALTSRPSSCVAVDQRGGVGLPVGVRAAAPAPRASQTSVGVGPAAQRHRRLVGVADLGPWSPRRWRRRPAPRRAARPTAAGRRC